MADRASASLSGVLLVVFGLPILVVGGTLMVDTSTTPYTHTVAEIDGPSGAIERAQTYAYGELDGAAQQAFTEALSTEEAYTVEADAPPTNMTYASGSVSPGNGRYLVEYQGRTYAFTLRYGGNDFGMGSFSSLTMPFVVAGGLMSSLGGFKFRRRRPKVAAVVLAATAAVFVVIGVRTF